MGHKTHVLLHFVMFECILDRFVAALNSVQNGPNWCIFAKVCAMKYCWNYSLRTHPIQTMGPKTHVLLHFVMFGSFGIVSLLQYTRSKMGRTIAINAKFCATKSRWNFSLRTDPIHTMGPYPHFLLHFVMFGCIWDYFATRLNLVQNRPNW